MTNNWNCLNYFCCDCTSISLYTMNKVVLDWGTVYSLLCLGDQQNVTFISGLVASVESEKNKVTNKLISEKSNQI